MSHVIANLLLVYFLWEYWYHTIGYDVMCFISESLVLDK